MEAGNERQERKDERNLHDVLCGVDGASWRSRDDVGGFVQVIFMSDGGRLRAWAGATPPRATQHRGLGSSFFMSLDPNLL